MVIFKGNLCPEGAVGKISGKEGLVFNGKASCSSPRRRRWTPSSMTR
nr:dihydroxy-acid dehydratase [Verrucomicrobium spinosum]